MIKSLPSVPHTSNQRSLTENLSPLYRKLAGFLLVNDKKQVKQQITIDSLRNDYKGLSLIVDKLQESLNKRMSVHEIYLLGIMRSQIDIMLCQVRQIVGQFNSMVKEKNMNQDLQETRDEVDYFKYQALKLFEENKVLKKQVSILKKQIQLQGFTNKCNSSALLNISKKLARQKFKRAALISDKKAHYQSQDTIIEPSIRKRHQSLLTQVKNAKCHNNQQYQLNKSNVGSTIHQTQIKKDTLQTLEDDRIDLADFEFHGQSQRLNALRKGERMAHIKKKILICKRKGHEVLNIEGLYE